jgi:uncharacterized protein (DUF58 family)
MAEGSAGRDELRATRLAGGAGRTLAASMPRLILESRKIAATVIHGLHGRRRAGSGENFWQFRRYVSGEEARRIDWRRSARDDHLYVREQEWEAAHTIWIWPDRSPSMTFASKLARESKLDRTLTICFALAEVLVEAGERVGLPGLMRPTGSRAVIDRMAEAIIHDPRERPSLPADFAPPMLSEVVILSDLWSPIEEIRATLTQLSANGSQGHLVQIVDPAEETFPYSGRVEFSEPETGQMITAGRAENWRADYEARLKRHRDELAAEAKRLAWSFTIHRTDRPANELLLALHGRIGEGNEAAVSNRRPRGGLQLGRSA